MKKIFLIWGRNKYLCLFASLIALIVLSPLIMPFRYASITIETLFSVVMIISFLTISETKSLFWLLIFFSLGSIITGWLARTSQGDTIAVINCAFELIFLIFIFSRLMYFIILTGHMNQKIIYVALSAYLILGLLFANTYQLLYTLDPQSFVFSNPELGNFDSINLYVNFFYFSFVTITTLGYGDILPVSPAARMFATLEALSGQIFVAVVIARLVSINQKPKIVKND